MNNRTGQCCLIAISTLISTMGCASVQDCRYEIRQQMRATWAWVEFDSADGICGFSSFSAAYRDGWKAGYYSVLTGGDGRPPVTPPRKHWDSPAFFATDSWTPQEWFKGFRDGGCAAGREPNHHFVSPWLSTPCCNCLQTSLVSNEGQHSSVVSIRLLGIEPLHGDHTATLSEQISSGTEQ